MAKGLANIIDRDEHTILEKLDRAVAEKQISVFKGLTYSNKKDKNLPLFELPSYKGGLIVEQQIVKAPLGKMSAGDING